ncbi:MAG: glycosyltransferase family 9 protein [Chlorobiaceae bacterium]|nr:glycosyltransferase family 9 protein [Chlorobiaceae bacterium]MBA4309913.1 glycosyltransferase family 9 protein [Chlorobiaceae bacterium]
MKILVIALSGIGDALMFTPALQLIKKQFPDSSIDAIVMYKGVKDIFSRTALFNQIHYHDFLNSSKFSSLKFVLSLRKKFDATINVYPSNRKEYNIISFLLGAKKRGAVKYLRSDFINLGFLNTHIVQENDSLHNVEENIRMSEKLFSTTFDSSPDLLFNINLDDKLFAEKFLTERNIVSTDLLIGFHPGCSTLKNHTKRRWEPEKFSQLAQKLIDEKNANIFVFGGPEEAELKAELISKVNSDKIFSVESRNLGESAALIKKCRLFITNDSSLMHVAASMKVKTVAIIGPTNTNYISPWNTVHTIASLNLECSPCFFYSPKPLSCSRTDVEFKCIKELDVNIVFESAEKFLRG